MSSDITPLELLSLGFRLLKPRTIRQLEQALERIGPHGELRIIKQDGEVKVIENVDDRGQAQSEEQQG